MNVWSLFSGIGGIDLGLERAGMRVVLQAESDGWRRELLTARFPGASLYDDVRVVGRRVERSGLRERESDATRREPWSTCAPAVLCGGFPCQDLSVAGRRRGLAGDRSGLFFEFARVAESVRPRWLLVENVPGLLSSNGGRDFGVVLGTLADLGYGLAWRILDSRFFGVPQRRRRVFIVGCLADGDPRAAGERAGQILAVGSRCGGHPQTIREAGPDVAGALGGCPPGGDWRVGADEAAVNQLVARPLTAHAGSRDDGESDTFVVAAPLSHGSNPNSNAAGRRREDDYNLVVGALKRTNGRSGASSYEPSDYIVTPLDLRQALRTDGRTGVGTPGTGVGHAGDDSFSVTQTPQGTADGAMVRRLTPRECERLQGFPDDWTQLGGTPDSRRYAALGDAVTVPVAEWIGRRLLQHVNAQAA